MVLATTAREREQVAEILTPRAAAAGCMRRSGRGRRPASCSGPSGRASPTRTWRWPMRSSRCRSTRASRSIWPRRCCWWPMNGSPRTMPRAEAAMRYGQTEPAARADLVNYLRAPGGGAGRCRLLQGARNAPHRGPQPARHVFPGRPHRPGGPHPAGRAFRPDPPLTLDLLSFDRGAEIAIVRAASGHEGRRFKRPVVVSAPPRPKRPAANRDKNNDRQ